MACEQAGGSTTACARGGSPWNRVLVKVASSRPSCNIFFAAVIHVAYTRFEADKDIMDALVGLRKRRERGGTTAGEPVPTTSLWGMLYADDAGVVSQLPEQLRKMMVVIVTVCAAFGLTVSEAKTEIMCLRTRGMPDATATFSVEAAGQVYKQTHEFVNLGGDVNHHDLSIEVDRRIRNAWCSFRKYSLELYDRPSAPLELKIRMLKAKYSRQCCTAASRGARARATTTRCAEPTTAS